tara:strand:+ start:800 stop:982 length:183 start_codon:yes stop_codon:yes gene_type:complete
MSKTNLIGSCQSTINSVLNRLSKIEGKEKEALSSEFREWLDAIESDNKNYDVLYINKINK